MQHASVVLADEQGDDPADVELTIEEQPQAGALVRTVAATNDGSAPVAIADLVVLAWEPPADDRDLRGGALWLNGRQMNSGVLTRCFGAEAERGGFAGAIRAESAAGICYTAAGGVALLATARGCRLWGFLGGARQFGEIRITVDRAERTLLRVECVCLLDGWRLAVGESVTSEQLLIAGGDDAAALLEEYAERAGALAGARVAAETRSGWCSWYSLYNKTSAEAVLANVAALREARLPLEIVQIDDGYQAATGDWLMPNDRFPAGMAALAEQIRAAGFAPGLWLAPLVLRRDSATLREHPDWAVRDHDGAVRYHNSWLGEVAALDCTMPAARAWLGRLIETVVHTWGYSYLKLDALVYAAQPGGLYHAPNTTAAANLRAGLEIVRAAAGEDAYLLACTCPFGPAIGLVDAMRVGADVEARWFDGEQAPSAFNALRLTLPRWFMQRRWWSNDPDCLLARTAGSALSRNEARTLATGIAITGGNVFLGDDVRDLTADDLAIVRALLPPGGVALRPRDLLERETPRLFAAASAGGALAALFNWQDEADTIGATAAQLEVPAGRYHLFEFWERLYLGALTGIPAERIAPHDCRLYRLTPDNGAPCVVGAGATIALHAVLGGENWDAARATLTLELAADATSPDTIFVAVPGALREATLEVSGALALERAGALLRLDVDPVASRHIVLRFVR